MAAVSVGGAGSGFSGAGALVYPEGLGLWLETDVENDCVVVRRVRPRSFADVEEDVRPGDQVRGCPLPPSKMTNAGARAKALFFGLDF